MAGDEQAAVLVVDDDAAIATVLVALLRQDGIAAESRGVGRRKRSSGSAASRSTAVITDLRMDGLDGFALLAEVAQRWPEIPVVVITAHATVPLAVDAMRRGAADFISEAVRPRGDPVRRAQGAGGEPPRCRRRRPRRGAQAGIVGAVGGAARTCSRWSRAPRRRTSTVLVLGETRHRQGARRARAARAEPAARRARS